MAKVLYQQLWSVYIAQCSDKTLDVGIAIDVKKRIKEHNTTNKCRYTRYRKPLQLIYSEENADYSSARKRESQIKKYRREKKLSLAETEYLKDISP
ncbi:MAG: GIY-YIG nuclease family protein [Candidatus Omnitrophota bacterium]